MSGGKQDFFLFLGAFITPEMTKKTSCTAVTIQLLGTLHMETKELWRVIARQKNVKFKSGNMGQPSTGRC